MSESGIKFKKALNVITLTLVLQIDLQTFLSKSIRIKNKGIHNYHSIIIFVNIVKLLHKHRIIMLFLKKMCYNGKNMYKEVTKMTVSYKKLWKLLIDRDMKKKDLQAAAGISPSSISKLSKNEYVSMDVLVKVCTALGVDFKDIMELVPNMVEERE